MADKILVRGAKVHNLKNIDVEFPLGLFIVVTGLSGSGKSTLVENILMRALHNHFYGKTLTAGSHEKIEGLENSAHYDHNIHEHYHFICTECKRVFDIPADVARDIVKNTEEKTGFVIQSHDVIFHGLCNDCKK